MPVWHRIYWTQEYWCLKNACCWQHCQWVSWGFVKPNHNCILYRAHSGLAKITNLEYIHECWVAALVVTSCDKHILPLLPFMVKLVSTISSSDYFGPSFVIAAALYPHTEAPSHRGKNLVTLWGAEPFSSTTSVLMGVHWVYTPHFDFKRPMCNR